MEGIQQMKILQIILLAVTAFLIVSPAFAKKSRREAYLESQASYYSAPVTKTYMGNFYHPEPEPKLTPVVIRRVVEEEPEPTVIKSGGVTIRYSEEPEERSTRIRGGGKKKKDDKEEEVEAAEKPQTTQTPVSVPSPSPIRPAQASTEYNVVSSTRGIITMEDILTAAPRKIITMADILARPPTKVITMEDILAAKAPGGVRNPENREEDRPSNDDRYNWERENDPGTGNDWKPGVVFPLHWFNRWVDKWGQPSNPGTSIPSSPQSDKEMEELCRPMYEAKRQEYAQSNYVNVAYLAYLSLSPACKDWFGDPPGKFHPNDWALKEGEPGVTVTEPGGLSGPGTKPEDCGLAWNLLKQELGIIMIMPHEADYYRGLIISEIGEQCLPSLGF